MNLFSDLNAENHDQILKYLRFFRHKKDGILHDIEREFTNLKNDRLDEDMFTRDDMIDFSEFVAQAIQTRISEEMGSLINMGALAMNQLLLSSQDRGYALTLEMAPLENQVLLEEINTMNLDALPKNPRTLTSFRDETKVIRDEKSRLEESNERLQNEVQTLRNKLSNADHHLSSLADSKQHDDELEKIQLKELEHALEEAKDENNRRVSDTTQFQQMRKLMQTQSNTIKELRRKLQKYEPDGTKEEDDDN